MFLQWQLRLLLVCSIAIGAMVQAQNTTTNPFRATTDPVEARALNRIFSRLGLGATQDWNISGELCSGVASDTVTQIDAINPGIKCDCSYNNNTICHIITLWIFTINAAGPLPPELWSLTYLTNLNLAQNYFTGPISASIRNLTRMQYMSFSLNALSGEVPGEIGQLSDLRLL